VKQIEAASAPGLRLSADAQGIGALGRLAH
jgi:hypothetical protein